MIKYVLPFNINHEKEQKIIAVKKNDYLAR
jgi:hypothetical protein